MLSNYSSQTQGSLHRIPTDYIYPLEKVINSFSCFLSFCVPFALTFFWGWEVYILIQYVYTSIYFEYRGSPSELRLESSPCRQRHGQPVLCAALKHRNFGLAFCIISIHSSVSRRGDLEGGVEHAASIFDCSRFQVKPYPVSTMSRPTRLPSGATLPTSINRSVSLTSGKSDSRAPALTAISRRSSISNLNLNLKTTSGPKAQRTSKTSQKLVVLPSAPQTKPFQSDFLHHGYETDNGIRETKSEAERMSKEERKLAGFKRITAYCIAEAFRMKLLASFLKREHNVFPRVFDEALYVVSSLLLIFLDLLLMSYRNRCIIYRYYRAMDPTQMYALLHPQIP